MRRNKDGPTMPVSDASKALGMSPNYLMERLREGQLKDVGFATQGSDGRWRYFIYKEKVKNLTGG